MKEADIKNFIYSSSCTVYGTPQFLPLTEKHPTGLGCTNPYAFSKVFTEQIMKDLAISDDVCYPTPTQDLKIISKINNNMNSIFVFL